MNYQELNKAIENKAIEHLESENITVNIDYINAAQVGFYRTLMSYLTQEQIDEIVRTHKLEI